MSDARRPAGVAAAVGFAAQDLSAVAYRLRVDTTAREVIAALESAGVATIVLKGRAFADLLYEKGDIRSYGDTDLLVASRKVQRARFVLARLGYEPVYSPYGYSDSGPLHAQGWRRSGDPVEIDLHWRLPGTWASARSCWRQLWRHTIELRLAGRPVRALDEPATALLCALHAAHHSGQSVDHPRQDLERAIVRLDPDTWRVALQLAEVLDARDSFGAGLGTVAAGRDLAASLGLRTARPPHAAHPAGAGALQLARLRREPSWKASLALVWTVVCPPTAEMRRHQSIARRGSAGLIVAYLLRPLRIASILLDRLAERP